MLCLMISAILVGTLPYISMAKSEAEILEDNIRSREALASVLPPEIVRETVDGFELHVLCDTEAGEAFGADNGSPTALSEKAAKRNEHLIIETGVQLSVSVTEDFVQTARKDILSGEMYYNLYAASVAPSLSALLLSGDLSDVTGSVHIRADKDWFDGGTMDKLAVHGKQYLISSATADARRSAEVVVYDRSAAEQTDLLPEEERSLAALALDGEFTLEAMLAASRAAYIAPTEGDALLGGANATPAFYGFGYGDEDIFSLYFGVGGNFLTADAEGFSVAPLATLRTATDSVRQLIGDPSAVSDADAFAAGNALFAVHKLAEIAALREAVEDIGILPLPKVRKEDAYRSYMDPAHTTMLAIPNGVAGQDKVEFLISRMAFLSYGYVEPVIKKQIVADNAEDEKILSLIGESVACDMSDLFGYGDIAGLIADTVHEGDDRLALEYYNRKTLYEKALSIIQKRIAVEQE